MCNKASLLYLHRQFDGDGGDDEDRGDDDEDDEVDDEDDGDDSVDDIKRAKVWTPAWLDILYLHHQFDGDGGDDEDRGGDDEDDKVEDEDDSVDDTKKSQCLNCKVIWCFIAPPPIWWGW